MPWENVPDDAGASTALRTALGEAVAELERRGRRVSWTHIGENDADRLAAMRARAEERHRAALAVEQLSAQLAQQPTKDITMKI